MPALIHLLKENTLYNKFNISISQESVNPFKIFIYFAQKMRGGFRKSGKFTLRGPPAAAALHCNTLLRVYVEAAEKSILSVLHHTLQ